MILPRRQRPEWQKRARLKSQQSRLQKTQRIKHRRQKTKSQHNSRSSPRRNRTPLHKPQNRRKPLHKSRLRMLLKPWKIPNLPTQRKSRQRSRRTSRVLPKIPSVLRDTKSVWATKLAKNLPNSAKRSRKPLRKKFQPLKKRSKMRRRVSRHCQR